MGDQHHQHQQTGDGGGDPAATAATVPRTASPEARQAVRDSAEALRRAVRTAEVDLPHVTRRSRELTVSNGFVWLFKQALGVDHR